ncbi:aryl-alcohol dehydrogenase [Mycena amicta]|nr:aryl-alcohol dehydrogenase [Mycena amicta]
MSTLPQRQSRVPYVRLGKSGLTVSKIILGCMSYGSSEWRPWTLDEEDGITHVKYAFDAGINTFDTADMYSNGMSEVVLGKAIKLHNIPREEIVIMTKLRHPVGKAISDQATALFAMGEAALNAQGYANQHGLSRKHIFASVKGSLARLGMEYIDVLQVHRFDYGTPIEETMRALHDVVQAGWVRYIGMSSCYAWQFQVMQNYALTHNLTPFISMQNHYNLLYREEEREMMPTLKHFGVGSIPWSPLARGALALQVPEGQTTRQASDELPAEAYFLVGGGATGSREIVKRVEEVAAKLGAGVSMAQVALAWLMRKDGVTAPIVGTTSLEKLDDLLKACELELSEEDVRYLEEGYKPMGVFLHN